MQWIKLKVRFSYTQYKDSGPVFKIHFSSLSLLSRRLQVGEELMPAASLVSPMGIRASWTHSRKSRSLWSRGTRGCRTASRRSQIQSSLLRPDTGNQNRRRRYLCRQGSLLPWPLVQYQLVHLRRVYLFALNLFPPTLSSSQLELGSGDHLRDPVKEADGASGHALQVHLTHQDRHNHQ